MVRNNRNKNSRGRAKSKNKVFASPVGQIVISIIIFVTATLASRGEQLASWEQNLFLHIYNWPDILHNFFYLATQLGSLYMVLALPLIVLFLKRTDIAIRLLATGASVYVLVGVAKGLFGRGRPQEFLADVVSRDITHGPGFPSGHTALAVALALTVAYYLRFNYLWIPAIWIALVGLSRIYLGAHLPLDIIGGFAVGWLVYAVFARIYQVFSAKTTAG